MDLFGFSINRTSSTKELEQNQSVITPPNEDGASSTVSAGGYYGTYLDLDASAKSESELITKYREISMYPDCSSAIDEIVTEAIAAVDDEKPIRLNLDNIDLTSGIKKKINDEFDTVLKLLDFNTKGFDLFRRWYVDGRLYYQKVIDMQNPKKGITEMRMIDPRKIRKVRDIRKEKLPNGIEIVKSIDEFYVYNEKGFNFSSAFTATNYTQSQGVKIAVDTITFVPSGLLDLEKSINLSYLHKAIKPTNQLKMMEDALVIYRISRAPERRIFYIDVGNLPKIKAEQYLKDIMARYRNKIVYDSATGEIRDDRKFMSMLEDFWLPRREGGRGTEITTLPGGENLSQIEDINYFQNKLYQALNVPLSRLQPQQGIQFGRAAEITRDELNFAKFVGRLRKKFNALFNDILKTQLLLKGIMTEQDWEDIKEDLQYRYAQDQYFQELKNTENLRDKIDLITVLQPFVGLYFSKDYVKRNVLRFSEAEIEKMAAEMEEDMANAPQPPQQMDAAGQPDGQDASMQLPNQAPGDLNSVINKSLGNQ